MGTYLYVASCRDYFNGHKYLLCHKNSCNCGKTGCIETIASATGIKRIAETGLLYHPESRLQATLIKEGSISSKDVFEAAEAGDEYAQQVVEKVSFHLGLVIANLTSSLRGFLVGTTLWIFMLVRIEKFDTPYFWPLIPFNMRALRDVILRAPMPLKNRRPTAIHPKDPDR